MTLWHRHDWILYDFNAIGRYEKQKGQGEASVFYCRGLLKKCGCHFAMLFPWDRRLAPVEIDPTPLDPFPKMKDDSFRRSSRINQGEKT